MLSEESKRIIIEGYQKHFAEHGDSPMATQNSLEGQIGRFGKLVELGDLRGRKILDLGCGIGDFYPVLKEKFGEFEYTGIDIVPEFIEHATKRYPEGRFFCQDILRDPIAEDYDYVLISGIFNNEVPEGTEFMKAILRAAFARARMGLGLNFTSTYVNFQSPGMMHHDPKVVMEFCFDELTRKLELHHHYFRCDVAMFLYR
jgi:SAM-dependent methyltransferase